MWRPGGTQTQVYTCSCFSTFQTIFCENISLLLVKKNKTRTIKLINIGIVMLGCLYGRCVSLNLQTFILTLEHICVSHCLLRQNAVYYKYPVVYLTYRKLHVECWTLRNTAVFWQPNVGAQFQLQIGEEEAMKCCNCHFQ